MTNPIVSAVIYPLPISAIDAALEGASYPPLADPKLLRKLAVQLGLGAVPAVWTTAGELLRAGRQLTVALLVGEPDGNQTPLLVCPLLDDATIERASALLTAGEKKAPIATVTQLAPRRERRAKATAAKKGKRK